MSGTDQIVINTRERASSGDVNDLQSLKDRTLLDSWLETFQRRTYAVGVQPIEVSQPIVLGGLEVVPNGTDIAVQAGVLLQDSTTLTPVPGAFDSDYRWAALRASAIISNPAPGGDTWYLIEAQMDDIVALTTTVDIFDPGTGLFVPTLVDKRTERTIATQLVAGDATNLPIPSGGDWVAIGGVLVPTGGGAIPTANFMDLRPLWTDLGPAVRPTASQGRRQVSIGTLDSPGSTDKDWQIEGEAWIGGRRLWFETDETGLELSATTLGTFQDGATTPTAINTLSYLYLAPLALAGSPTSFVRNAYAEAGFSNLNGNCLLVWSTNPPGTDRETNSVAIALPAPFDNYLVPIGEAVCIGALHTGTAAGEIIQMGGLGTNFQTVDHGKGTPIAGWGDSVAPTGGSDAYTITDAPVCAKTLRCLLVWLGVGGGSVREELFVQETGAGDRWYEFRGSWDGAGQVEFTIPRRTTIDIEFDGVTPPGAAVLYLIGWSL